MTAHRLRVGLAVTALGLAVCTGTASAQVAGCSFSDCTPQGTEVTTTTTAPTTTTTEAPGGGVLGEGASAAPGGEVLGEEATAAPGTVEANSATAPAGSLPFTGADVAGLVLIGGASLAVGTVLVRRSRTQS